VDVIGKNLALDLFSLIIAKKEVELSWRILDGFPPRFWWSVRAGR